MSRSFVVVAHTAKAGPKARTVAAQLNALGYGVRRELVRPGRNASRAISANTCRRVVLLWSRSGDGVATLHAEARRLKASGKLVLVRLDAARPPVGLGDSEAIPFGPYLKQRWRRLVDGEKLGAAAEVDVGVSRSTSRMSAILAVLLLASIAGAAAYAADADFAAQVNSWASFAKARASMLVGRISG